jgi:hypothetical protein
VDPLRGSHRPELTTTKVATTEVATTEVATTKFHCPFSSKTLEVVAEAAASRQPPGRLDTAATMDNVGQPAGTHIDDRGRPALATPGTDPAEQRLVQPSVAGIT